MDTGAIVTLCTTAGALVGGLVAAAINFLKGRSEIKLAERKAEAEEETTDRKTTISEWQEIVEQLKQQSERRDKIIDQLQDAISILQEENASCREENAELRMVVKFLYDHMSRLHTLLVSKGGIDPGPMPQMPELRDRNARSRADFIVTQATHSAHLVKEVDKVIESKDGPKDGKVESGGDAKGDAKTGGAA